MRLRLYCIKDTVSGDFYPPAGFRNDAAAVRGFLKGFRDNDEFPSMKLMCVGTWDTESGNIDGIEPYDVPVNTQEGAGV